MLQWAMSNTAETTENLEVQRDKTWSVSKDWMETLELGSLTTEIKAQGTRSKKTESVKKETDQQKSSNLDNRKQTNNSNGTQGLRDYNKRANIQVTAIPAGESGCGGKVLKLSWNHKMIETETRFVVARSWGGGRGGGEWIWLRKGSLRLLVMETFRILAAAGSASCLWYGTRILHDAAIGETGTTVQRDLCVISYNCMWVYGYHKQLKKKNTLCG